MLAQNSCRLSQVMGLNWHKHHIKRNKQNTHSLVGRGGVEGDDSLSLTPFLFLREVEKGRRAKERKKSDGGGEGRRER